MCAPAVQVCHLICLATPAGIGGVSLIEGLAAQALIPKQLEPEMALCMKPVIERAVIERAEATKPAKRRKAVIADKGTQWVGQVVPDVDVVIEEIAHLGAGLVEGILPIER